MVHTSWWGGWQYTSCYLTSLSIEKHRSVESRLLKFEASTLVSYSNLNAFGEDAELQRNFIDFLNGRSSNKWNGIFILPVLRYILEERLHQTLIRLFPIVALFIDRRRAYEGPAHVTKRYKHYRDMFLLCQWNLSNWYKTNEILKTWMKL